MTDPSNSSQDPLAKRFAEAISLHQQRRLAEAETAYRAVLKVNPGHAEALHQLGILAYEVGQAAVAAEFFGRAIQSAPNEARFHANLASVLNDLGKPAEAIEQARRAIGIDPAMSAAHLALGVANQKLRQFDAAASAFQDAIRRDPQSAVAHTNLGSTLSAMGKLDQAIESHRAAVRLSPSFGVAHYNLGVLLKQTGQLAAAIEAFEASIRAAPKLYEARIHLGLAYEQAARFEEARRAFQIAIELNPGRGEGYNNLANLLLRSDQPEAAIELFQKLLSLDPHNATALGNLANALKDQGQLDESLEMHRRALAIDPGNIHVHSSLLLLMHNHPKCGLPEIGDESRRWATLHADHLAPVQRRANLAAVSTRRLKIGYVSADFREHYIGRVMLELLEHHDPQSFEIHCYSNSRREDELTRAIRATPAAWHDITLLDDHAAASQIAQDGIDLLVDLSCHMSGGRPLIFARRPAPVQIMWLAYPGTTGMAAMDYSITDPYIDPPGENDPCYSEKSVYLPHCYWLFSSRRDSAEVTPLPALSSGGVTFGSFNTFSKINPDLIDLWAGILKQTPDSRLLLLAPVGVARRRVHQLFAAQGVSEARINFVGRAPRGEYLKYYQQTDLILDTFPWNGHTTTLDALWMGVPTITLAGRSPMSRGGLSVLSNLGLPELVASCPQDYTSLAVRVAQDLRGLSKLRSELRQRMRASPLMNPAGYTHALEQIYRKICLSC